MPDPGPASRSRADLLAMSPQDALREGLRGDAPGGLARRLDGEGALALVEQLRAGRVPPEALDLCVVAFDRARDGLPGGGRLDAGRVAALERGLAVQAQGYPELARWTDALAGRCAVREDVDAAVAFLLKAKQVRAVADALTARPR